MQFLDKPGWPVARVKNRPILNAIRLLIHARKIKRGRFTTVVPPDPNTQAQQEQTDENTD